MNSLFSKHALKTLAGGFFSPAGLLIRAAAIGIVFLAIHFAGWRDHTSVLSATVGATSTAWNTSAAFGITYLVIYMAFVVLAPILTLAAGILALLNRYRQ